MNLNLTTKTVNVANRSIKSTWSREQMDDLTNMYKSFKYKVDNQTEIDILQRYFKLKLIKEEFAFYSIPSKQEIRRLKLLILKHDEIADIIQKILDNSELVTDPSVQDMEDILVQELTNEINKSIMSQLMNMSNFKYGK